MTRARPCWSDALSSAAIVLAGLSIPYLCFLLER